MKIVSPSVELISFTPDPEALIARCAKVCYQSHTDDEKVLRHVLANGHDSVLEHASATFLITTDRGITHELVRHRIASFSQESTRYCGYDKNKFGSDVQVIPPLLLTEEMLADLEKACDSYMRARSAGATAQEARDQLPTCTKAQIAMTANFRELRHFLMLRTHSTAHPKMRVVANLIWEELKKIAPLIFRKLPKTEAMTREHIIEDLQKVADSFLRCPERTALLDYRKRLIEQIDEE
jgi:thymidylate synthase (FAD)